ncbi:MAG: hypothetical protein D6704_09670, partial [Nitrospirae bacterium]
MKLKRFEALTLQDALAAVKAEFGSEAVIISTRRVTKGNRLFGLLSQPVVEVTAAVDHPAPTRSTKPMSARHTQAEEPADEERERGNSWYEPPHPDTLQQ